MAVGLSLVLGVVASGGQWLVILAHRIAPASLLAPFFYTQLLWVTGAGVPGVRQPAGSAGPWPARGSSSPAASTRRTGNGSGACTPPRGVNP